MDHESDSADVETVARQLRQARVIHGITVLLAEHPELRDVLPGANLIDESVRWSA